MRPLTQMTRLLDDVHGRLVVDGVDVVVALAVLGLRPAACACAYAHARTRLRLLARAHGMRYSSEGSTVWSLMCTYQDR